MDVNTILNNIDKYMTTTNTTVTATKSQDEATNKDSKKDNLSEDSKYDNEKNNKSTKKEVDSAVKKLNKLLERENTHAEYSEHKELGTIMVKIIDDDTKKIILEVPSEKILNMVASMCEEAGLIDKKA